MGSKSGPSRVKGCPGEPIDCGQGKDLCDKVWTLV